MGTLNSNPGRSFRRGTRSYFLVSKIIGITMFLGGSITMFVQIRLHPDLTNLENSMNQAELLKQTFDYVIIPGVIIAVISGILLIVPIFKPITRMRWFQLKAILLILEIPTLHIYMRSQLQALHHKIYKEYDLLEAQLILSQLFIGLAVAVIFAVVLICLGRIKPRLGQQYGRSIFLKRNT